MSFNRRRFLTTTAGAAGSLAVASAFGSRAFAQDAARIRHFWWGNPERDRRTFEVIDIFNGKNPDIVVEGETLGFNDYFTKLTTQIAGGNMPDVIQMGYGVMLEYIDKGTLKPLDEAVAAGKLDISEDRPGRHLDAGTFDGKLYGYHDRRQLDGDAVSIRASLKRHGDRRRPDQLDLRRPQGRRRSRSARRAEPKGTDDMTADWGGFGVYFGQRGFASQFNDDGSSRSAPTSSIDYWKLWQDIRDAGATPSRPKTPPPSRASPISTSRASSRARARSPTPGRTRSSARRR